ncbi:carboxypeptidase-like regulatory domain-containing protein [Flavobacterium sp.]|uniref:carboxypeptidase-like regulatory domain-containing protein n=1 Tax=Flavobacterium sp. TaxID=239 RepID=UPI0012260DE8|nr:carboxypeptidase-like regulatory domain-containing protein [Flavobacterium sp.]RZJ72944.1 MAG: hypothetical protein EOO49_04755 [Flavobacterium sp.]
MKTYSLKIPKPCHENWSEMSPDDKGRFCGTCEKKVHDFSNAPDREIISVLKSSDKICGRFTRSQLGRELVGPREPSVLLPYVASGVLGMLSVASAQAQEKPNEQTVLLVGNPLEEVVIDTTQIVETEIMGDVMFVEERDFFTLVGTVFDNSDKLPGVSVTNLDLKNQASTDVNGKYRIEVRKGDRLVFSYIGYSDTTFPVGDSMVCDVNLKENAAFMGEVVVSKSNIFKRAYYKVRNWFR